MHKRSMRPTLGFILAAAGTTAFFGNGLLAQPNTPLSPVISEVLPTSVDTVIRLGARGKGKTWRGSIGDTITVTYTERGAEKAFTGRLDNYREIGRNLATMTVVGTADGSEETRTFVVGDVLAIKTIDKAAAPATNQGTSAPDSGKDNSNTSSSAPKKKPDAAPATTHAWGFPTHPGEGYDHLPKVFLLPIEGGVGEGTRHEEMEQIGEIADQYGPGQIIVLKVDSPGGLVLEADMIHDTLMDLKQRHRIIAWIEEAISAAAYTSFHCNEVYFMKTGALGSATMFAGGKAIEGERLRQWVKKFGDVADESGHPRALAEAMVTNSEMCSYDPAVGDKPPVVYHTTEGKIVLSTNQENLTINATDAMDCGFADGIADNEEELAQQLRLPRWYETTDQGRKIHADWHKTLENAKDNIPILTRQLQGATGQTNDQVKNLNRQLTACNKLIAWARRLGAHAGRAVGCPPLEYLEEAKKTLMDQIRRAKAAQR